MKATSFFASKTFYFREVLTNVHHNRKSLSVGMMYLIPHSHINAINKVNSHAWISEKWLLCQIIAAFRVTNLKEPCNHFPSFLAQRMEVRLGPHKTYRNNYLLFHLHQYLNRKQNDERRALRHHVPSSHFSVAGEKARVTCCEWKRKWRTGYAIMEHIIIRLPLVAPTLK